ncbi:MAG: hypothetical protein IJQ75_04420 [Synergistaceae bacterium]|nr:hypothetical protein [Synergistaceae bacterium]
MFRRFPVFRVIRVIIVDVHHQTVAFHEVPDVTVRVEIFSGDVIILQG